MTKKPKRAALSVRIQASTKKAMEKAAEEDHRSTASMVEIALKEWLSQRPFQETTEPGQ